MKKLKITYKIFFIWSGFKGLLISISSYPNTPKVINLPLTKIFVIEGANESTVLCKIDVT